MCDYARIVYVFTTEKQQKNNNITTDKNNFWIINIKNIILLFKLSKY